MNINKNKNTNVYLDLDSDGNIIYVDADTGEELGVYDYRSGNDYDDETAS